MVVFRGIAEQPGEENEAGVREGSARRTLSHLESVNDVSPLCRVSSLQPGVVQSERLPHLCGPDQSPESGPVLCLRRSVSDHLELPGRGGNRALPDTATVYFKELFLQSAE